MMRIPITETGTYSVRAINTISGYISPLSNEVVVISTKSKPITIGEVFQDVYNNGLFKNIFGSNTDVGNLLKGIYNTADILDVEYLYKRSGNKKVSVMIENFVLSRGLSGDGCPITTKQLNIIINIINSRYYNKWQKEYDTLSLKYDVLNPYKMEINETNDDTLTSSNNKNYADSQSNQGYVTGYDSDVAHKSDSTELSQDGTSSDSYTRSANNARNLSRKGNIGNVTYQKLIEEERRILEWQFADIIFTDIDKLLTRPVYA